MIEDYMAQEEPVVKKTYGKKKSLGEKAKKSKSPAKKQPRSRLYEVTGSDRMLGNENILLNYDFIPVRSFKLPSAISVNLTTEQYKELAQNPSLKITVKEK